MVLNLATITGKVTTGLGRGRKFCSMPPYRNAFRDLMGIEVFPGTLNIHLEKQAAKAVWSYMKREAILVPEFKWKGKEYGAVQLAHVDINGVPSAIVAPLKTSHTQQIVEIISSQKLRDSLGLRDGDEVKLEFPGRITILQAPEIRCIIIEALRAKFANEPFTDENVSCMTRKRTQVLIQKLLAFGALVPKDEGYCITPLGRSLIKVVLTGGVYDLLHVGHLVTLKEAKKLGDFLFVIVARDKTVEKLKHRKPINNEKDRMKLLSNLKPVDTAILGQEKNYLDTALKHRPDIIALGHDQSMDENAIKEFFEEKGYPHVSVVRLKAKIEGKSTTNLIKEAQSRLAFK